MTDATIYSSTGYSGADVEGIIKKLLHAANGNVKAAERGIVYIDEIDKTSRKGENLSTTADPGHEGVQQALLKLLEGTVIDIPENGRRIHPDAKTISVNTENILFIVGGSFEGIEKIIAKRLRTENGKGLLGFGSDLVDRKNENFNNFIEKVTVEDLRKFGMLPELLGRLPVIVPMRELTEEQLVNILYKPKNALVKQYRELFRHDGIDFTVTEPGLQVIARKALARRTGARGLRGIMEDILNPVMFEMPDREEDKITVDAENDEIKISYETTTGRKEVTEWRA
nr:MAG TPA: ATP-dependent protease ATP-binding subunit [Caudoviricetes sp.]